MKLLRKIGIVLIIAGLILFQIPSSVADAASGDGFQITDGVLTDYTGTATTVTVPSTVTTIGESAFESNTTVQKVVLPDSVTKIEPYAFWGCSSLSTVSLGSGLKQIDDYAFTNCTGLQSMVISSPVTTIGIQSFAYCTNLQSISIASSVTDIHEDAFDEDCQLTINAELGSYAYSYAQDFYERQKSFSGYGSDDVSGTVTADDTGDAADTSAPQGNSASTDVSGGDLPSGQTPSSYETQTRESGNVLGSTHVVGNRAVVIMQNSALNVQDGSDAGAVQDSASAVSDTIEERQYYRSQTLGAETVPAGIREIGDFAYARSSVTSIALPEGLEKIGYAAFYHCDALTDIEIPDTVTEVEAKAFSHTAWVDDFLNGNGSDADGDFLISGGVLVAYRGSASEVVVPDGVRVIAGEAFADHTEIKNVTLPDSVIFVAEDAFDGCSLDSGSSATGGVSGGDSISDGDLFDFHTTVTSLAGALRSGSPYAWIRVAAVVMLAAGSICVVIQRRHMK